MKVKLTKIGNSYGFRIPAAIVKQMQFHNGAEMNFGKDKVIINALNNDIEDIKMVRAKWKKSIDNYKIDLEKSLKNYKSKNDIEFDDGPFDDDFTKNEWVW